MKTVFPHKVTSEVLSGHDFGGAFLPPAAREPSVGWGQDQPDKGSTVFWVEVFDRVGAALELGEEQCARGPT